MQGYRIQQIDRLLKRNGYFDLFAVRTDENSAIQLRRKIRIPIKFEYDGKSVVFFKDSDQHIISLTDNWQLGGQPVEWGLEPLIHKVSEIDSWRDDSFYEKLVEKREQQKRNTERSNRNEFKANAADARKDFAKVTNDINTSLINKTDNRRKYGNSK